MSLYDTYRRYLDEEIPFTLATVIAGPEGVGSKVLVQLGGSSEGEIRPAGLEEWVRPGAVGLLRQEQSGVREYALPEGEFSVFIESYPAPHQIVVVGAAHAAGPLSSFAKALGYRVIVTDARAAFAVPERFPDADQVIKGWPQDVLPGIRFDASTYLVLLSHDPKFDEPTLQHVLPTPVAYIGAIGSRKTQLERFERLRAQGFTDDQLAKIYGPVGLDLGGRSTEETALAILAEITAVRYGREGGFMRRKLEGMRS
jgi:xanthine dehydrogenase accessory factor